MNDLYGTGAQVHRVGVGMQVLRHPAHFGYYTVGANKHRVEPTQRMAAAATTRQELPRRFRRVPYNAALLAQIWSETRRPSVACHHFI